MISFSAATTFSTSYDLNPYPEARLMYKVSILLPDLRIGGAERVAVNLANYWSHRGIQVELVVMNTTGGLLKNLDPLVNIYNLDSSRIRETIIRFAKYLRRAKPDIIISNMWPLSSTAVLSWHLAMRPGRLFICEHISLSHHITKDLQIPLLLSRIVIGITHRSSSGVICVSDGVSRDLSRLSAIPLRKIKTIYNPVVDQSVSCVRIQTRDIRKHLWNGDFTFHLLAVGSLKLQKNYSVLLRSLSKVTKTMPIGLAILGDGPEKTSIRRQIEVLGLQRNVYMPGFMQDPSPWYLAADLFVLSSDYEGFANVVAESLGFGTPVVATNCPYGPAEILDNGRYGKLVPPNDPDLLAAAITESLSTQHDHAMLRKRGLRFSISSIALEYMNHFDAS